MVFQANPFPWLQCHLLVTTLFSTLLLLELGSSYSQNFVVVVGFVDAYVDWLLVGFRILAVTVDPIGWLVPVVAL